MQSRLGIKIGSVHALWTWAARHPTRYELVCGKSYKRLLAEYGEPGHGYIKGTKGKQDCVYGKVKRQNVYVLTDGVQIVLSKCARRTDQDGSKYLPIYTRASKLFHGSAKPTLEAESLPLREEQKHYQTDIPREHVMVKFRDEDAEVVMAKALEGGSDTEKEELQFPEPMEVPALLEC